MVPYDAGSLWNSWHTWIISSLLDWSLPALYFSYFERVGERSSPPSWIGACLLYIFVDLSVLVRGHPR